MHTIYVADDEKSIRDLIKMVLQEEDMIVKTFETGDQLLLAFMEKQADLVILDVMMPGSDGFSIARKIRQVSQVPLFLLTALDSDQDYIDGFSTGIDDYLTKPFSPVKLALKVKAILTRQSSAATLNKLSFESLSLLSAPPQLMIDGHTIGLTNTEYKVMKLLLTEPNYSVSREQLLDEVWELDSDVETRVTDDTMKRLRKKLRQVDSHVIIETVWGYGFKLSKKESS
ncbi:response regulator transcription factor [Streptococcus halotolerans]|uniref:response regulator transcription factor n=1 Tax=Streptococcus halotolerans TaxID=1814128 RepID=UPI0009EEC532|nr:response regulator transcription factor [Streptococcus halotolerans]